MYLVWNDIIAPASLGVFYLSCWVDVYCTIVDEEISAFLRHLSIEYPCSVLLL